MLRSGLSTFHCRVSVVLWALRPAAELCVRDCLEIVQALGRRHVFWHLPVTPWTLRFCQLCRKGPGICARGVRRLLRGGVFSVWSPVNISDAAPLPPAPDFVIPWKNTASCNEADPRMVSYINCKHFYWLHLSCSAPLQPSTLLFRVRGERAPQQVWWGLFTMDIVRAVEDSGYQCSDEHWCRAEWGLWWDQPMQDKKIHSWVVRRCLLMHFTWNIGKISSWLID